MSAPQTQRWTRRPEGSNWGDFGPDDQVGRLNLITDDMRLAAVSEVKEGKAFALSLPLDFPGGEGESASRRGPKLFAAGSKERPLYNQEVMPNDFCCDDGVTLWLQYSTQWDSLAHWGRAFDVDGSGKAQPVYYNGYRAHEHLVGPNGDEAPHARALGIENMAVTGVQGRGVLVNCVKAFGPGPTVVGYDLLMRAIDEQKVDVRKGDFLVLYTGLGEILLSANKQPGSVMHLQTVAALDGEDEKLMDWIDSSGIVAICSDNHGIEAFDFSRKEYGPNGMLPLHDRCLFKLGVYLGEFWWLGDLARHLEKVGRNAFLLTAPPLRLPGAVGSPTTPVATV